MSEVVLYEAKCGIAKIKLNRPEAMNAISDELRDQLEESLRKAIKDPEVKVVILCGAGKAFCAGQDLKVAAEHMSYVANGKMTGWELCEWATGGLQELTRLQRNPTKVFIAAVQGWAVGAGFEMTIACDLVVAAEGTKFGFPELEAGMSITNGATKLLPSIVGLNRAREWMLTGNWVTVDEAHRAGLVNKIVPPGQQEEAAEEIAKTIMSRKWPVVLTHKRLLNASLSCDLETSLWYEQAAILAAAMSGAADAGIKEFAERERKVSRSSK